MLVQQVVVLCNVPVVEIGDPEIEKNIEEKRKIEYRKIKTILAWSHDILHRAVDAKNPEGLNQQIKKKEKTEIS